jgi:N-acetylmuramoyl-L-alanine amidase
VLRKLSVVVTLIVLTAGGLVAATARPVFGRPDRAGSVQPAVASATHYAARHDMRSGIAVVDTRTGRTWSAGSRRFFPSASVVKTMIAARLLLSGRMNATIARQARAMISRSDNDAAWSLYPKVGRDRLLPWLERHYRDRFGARPAMPGIWGSTRLTATGLVRFYQDVRADHTVWPWLSRAMHAYAATSSAGEPNAFGIAAESPRAAVKNGWDTHRDPAHPNNAIVNSTGFVAHDRYAVAILSEGPGRMYYAPGERVVTGEAARVVPALLARHDYPHSGPVPPTNGPPPNGGTPIKEPVQRWLATVVLDPGHNGGNSTHLREINRPVYAGYGRYKPCNTTGTATNAGYPEHAFTWAVSRRVGRILNAHHIRVIMTRPNDTGVGPCVNVRAWIESRTGVDAAIAIHADGAPAGDHGFHLCVDSRRPEGATKATVAHTRTLNTALHRALTRYAPVSPSNYVGRNSYYYRDDLAGLNLSTNPTAFLEIGNMRNAHDARVQSSPAGRARIARAVAHGILAYLRGRS